MDSFLAIAEELKLKGLTGQTSSDLVEKPTNLKPANKTKESRMRSPRENVCNDQVENVYPVENISRTLAIPIELSGDLHALAEKVKSMMGKSQNMIPAGKQANGTPRQETASICKVCGKEGLFTLIRNHIESNHLEGISIPCDHCDKAFSSRDSLSKHKSRFHK